MKGFMIQGRKIAYRIVILLAMVQIGAGILWVICNLGRVPEFTGTRELLEISRTLVTDEYVGIIYPFLIRMTMWAESVLKIPYHYYLYFLQLAVGYYALKRLLLSVHCPKARWVVLWIMTLPTVLQLYLAVRPQALAVSMLLLCLCNLQEAKWIRGGVFWCLAGLLIPEYFWFAGGGYLCCLLFYAWKKQLGKKAWLRSLLCMAAVCLATSAVHAVTVEDHSRGRMIRTPLSMMLNRIVWPHYGTNSYFWHSDVHALFDEEGLKKLAQNPDNSVTTFGATMEQTYEYEWVETIYKYMILFTWDMRTKEIVGDIVNDLWGYGMPLTAFIRNLEGEGVSFAAWYYAQMSRECPVLTKWYVHICGRIFALFMFIALALLIYKIMGRKKITSEGGLAAALGIVCILQIVWYTMSMSGSLDYTNVMLVSMGWGILAANQILSALVEKDT